MADENLRSRAQIEAELTSARARLAENLQSLVGEVHPKAIKERRVEDVKQFATNEFENAKATAQDQVMDENGEWRMDRIAMIGGAVVGAVVLLAVASAASKKRNNRKLQAKIVKQLERYQSDADIATARAQAQADKLGKKASKQADKLSKQVSSKTDKVNKRAAKKADKADARLAKQAQKASARMEKKARKLAK